MKKIFLSFLVFLLIPACSFAISLDELKAESNKYVLLSKSPNTEAYGDRDTAQFLKDSPPYYTMACEFYYVDYQIARIMHMYILVNYDYNRSLKTLANNILIKHPNDRQKILKSPEKYEEELKREILANNGMKASFKIKGVYDLEGRLVLKGIDLFTDINKPIVFNSMPFYVANALFYKYKHEYFCYSTY